MPRKEKPGQPAGRTTESDPYRLWRIPCTMLIGSRSPGAAVYMAEHVANVAVDLEINGFIALETGDTAELYPHTEIDGMPIVLDDHGNLDLDAAARTLEGAQ